MEKDFVIKGIESIKFLDKDGNELKDLRDREPILKKTKLDNSIIDLILHHTTVPLEWTNEELFCKYGYAYFGIGDGWEWHEDKLKEAPEIDLWKIYGLCNEYWCNQYNFWYNKEVKKFRDYKRSKGEDLNVLKLTSGSFNICDNDSIKLRIFADKQE